MTNHHQLSWRKIAEGITDEGSGILEPDILSSSPSSYMRNSGLREIELWAPGHQRVNSRDAGV